MNELELEARMQDPGYQKRRLPAMAPAQDPVLRGVKRTSPIYRTCNQHGKHMVNICLMIRQEKDKITKKDEIGKIVTTGIRLINIF